MTLTDSNLVVWPIMTGMQTDLLKISHDKVAKKVAKRMPGLNAEYTYTKGVDKRPKGATTGRKRFRFETFAERIQNINIDVAHELPSKYVDDDITEDKGREAEDIGKLKSYFAEALEQWIELDLTRQFRHLAAKLRPISNSLTQVLWHKDDIVRLILATLRGKDLSELDSSDKAREGGTDKSNDTNTVVLAWESCFDLLIALARYGDEAMLVNASVYFLSGRSNCGLFFLLLI